MSEYLDSKGNRYRAQATAHGWRIGVASEKGKWRKMAEAGYCENRADAEQLLKLMAKLRGWEEI